MTLAESARLPDVMSPGDGYVVALAEVFIDESYNDGNPRLLCIAGYVFRKAHAKEFAKAWAPYLNRKKGLPYFHIQETTGPHGIFEGRKDVGEICRRLITETRRWSAMGFAVTIDEDLYDRTIAGKHGVADTAYGFALLQTMIMVRRWRERSGFDGEFNYFFEHGHKHRGDANRFLQRIFRAGQTREKYGYRGHAFVPKETHCLHPADMLAWHWRLENVRQLDPNRRPVRKDLVALLRPQDVCIDYTSRHLLELEAELERAYGGKTLVPG